VRVREEGDLFTSLVWEMGRERRGKEVERRILRG
jgi:hypothetical protein